MEKLKSKNMSLLKNEVGDINITQQPLSMFAVQGSNLLTKQEVCLISINCCIINAECHLGVD